MASFRQMLFVFPVVLGGSPPTQTGDDKGAQLEWTWSACPSSAGKITSVSTSPGSPSLGSDFTASLTIELGSTADSDISKLGGTITGDADVEVLGESKQFPISVDDICNDLKIDQDFPMNLGHLRSDGIDCSVSKPGSSVTIKVDANIASVARFTVPSGSVHIEGKTKGGNPATFLCADVHFKMSGWEEKISHEEILYI
jgi:hypothetical protein